MPIPDMSVLIDDKLQDIISRCGNDRLPAEEFIKILGLPHAKEKDGKPGTAKFLKDVKEVTKLYRMTMDIVSELKASYETKPQLREATINGSLPFLKERIANILSQYGPVVWSATEPYSTVIDENYYPRYLKYNDSQDCEKIATCIYYWITHRALKGFYTVNKKRLRESLIYNRRCAMKSSTAATVQDPNALYSHDLSLSLETGESDDDSSGEYCESRSRRAEYRWKKRRDVTSMATPLHVQNSQVPGAQTRSSTSEIAGQTGLTMQGILAFDLSPSEQYLIPVDPYEGYEEEREDMAGGSAVRMIKRRGFSGPDDSRLSDKLMKKFRKRRVDQDQGSENEVQQPQENTSPLTPGYAEQEVSETIAPSNPLPQSIPHNWTTPFIFKESESANELHGLPRESQGIDEVHGGTNMHLTSEINNNIVDQSPVELTQQGSMRFTAEEAPAIISSAPQSQTMLATENFGHDHKHLAPKLLGLLRRCQPAYEDLASIEITIEFINKIIKGDGSKLDQPFGSSSEQYKTNLNRWLECMNSLLNFRKITGFEGDREVWKEMLWTLPHEKRDVALELFYNTRSAICKWTENHRPTSSDVFKDLAVVFFHIADWGGLLELDILDDQLSEFNDKLLTWFG